MFEFKIVDGKALTSFLRSTAFKSMCECKNHCQMADPALEVMRKYYRQQFRYRTTGWLAMLLAAESRQVVACCDLLTDPWNTCTIESVCVHSDRRGTGLCKTLITSVCGNLKASSDVGRLRIYAYTNNPGACACYRSVFGPPVHIRSGSESSHAFEMELRKPESQVHGKS